MSERNYIEVVKKLKALAERGEGAEREKAKKLMDELIKKHDLDPSQFESDTRNRHLFDVYSYDEIKSLLLRQIFAYIENTINISDWVYLTKERKRRYVLLCSDGTAAQIRVMLDFYWKEFKVKQKRFMAAFVQANGLAPEAKGKNPKPLSKDEIEMLSMAGAITPSEFVLALDKGEQK